MNDFLISNLQDSSILSINDMKDTIKIDPDYQREGGVWNLETRQLFIDSLLNKYDVPKFYFHHLAGKHKDAQFVYSIIDGRQRLETIWDFIEGKFPLSDKFQLLEDPTTKIGGLTYIEIAKNFPRLATRLNGRTLSVIVVSTDDIDFIEDMFTRLNEAVPLNAAEKRNSFGGPLPRATRALVMRKFFSNQVRIPPTRYQHHDLVAKILYLQWYLSKHDKVPDTKKTTLDDFYKEFSKKTERSIATLMKSVLSNIALMEKVFTERDTLLRSTGVIPVYYLLFAFLAAEGKADKIQRKLLMDFEKARAENRAMYAAEQEGVDRRLLEYDDLARSSNDAASIATRLNIMVDFVAPDDPAADEGEHEPSLSPR
jgi:hypothetical protein